MPRKMKESGVEWLGQIPDGWGVRRFRAFLRNVSEKNHPDAEVLSLYREFGVLPKNSRDDNHNVTGEDTSQYKFVRKGDLVINKMKAWQGSFGVSDYEGIVSPAYYVCRFVSDEVNVRYFHYLVRTKVYAQEFERLSTGMRIGQWDLGIEDFMRVPALVPLCSEQERIAAFLDERCAKIDGMIAEAKASIEGYKKWKQSIIFEAVTGKHEKNLKPSGVDWIGDVPEGWIRLRLKDYYDFEKGVNAALYTKEYVGEHPGEYPVYSGQTENNGVMGLMDRFDYEFDECLFSTTVGAKVMTPLLLRGKFSLSQNCLIMVPRKKDISNTFFYYGLHPLFAYAKSLIPSYMQPSLRIEDLRQYFIFGPEKVDEQRRIAAELDEKCAAIDKLVGEKEALIADLEAYKKSLIFEIVTGKREIA